MYVRSQEQHPPSAIASLTAYFLTHQGPKDPTTATATRTSKKQ